MSHGRHELLSSFCRIIKQLATAQKAAGGTPAGWTRTSSFTPRDIHLLLQVYIEKGELTKTKSPFIIFIRTQREAQYIWVFFCMLKAF